MANNITEAIKGLTRGLKSFLKKSSTSTVNSVLEETGVLSSASSVNLSSSFSGEEGFSQHRQIQDNLISQSAKDEEKVLTDTLDTSELSLASLSPEEKLSAKDEENVLTDTRDKSEVSVASLSPEEKISAKNEEEVLTQTYSSSQRSLTPSKNEDHPESKKSASLSLTTLKTKLFPASLSKPGQPVGLISAAYDLGQEYRVMAWNARLMSMGFALSLLVNLGLSFVCFGLFPLKEVQPYVLGLQDGGKQVIQIEPLLKTVEGRDKLIEGLCRKYVFQREEIDTLSEPERWKDVYYLSSEEVWSEFTRLMDYKAEGSLYKQHVDKKATRAVRIDYSSRMGDNVYQVEWESVTCIGGQEVERRRWVSTLEIALQPNRVSKENEFVNPIGFTVMGYRISKRTEDTKRALS